MSVQVPHPGRVCRRSPSALLVAAILSLFLASCARVTPPVPPLSPAPSTSVTAGWTERGVASWYGDPFHGRTTASGETYDMEAMTAAHQSLPFGTVVLVENLQNGRSTTLRINDRGPFVRGRTIDVSRRAARELGLIGPGTAPVQVTIIDAPAAPSCWEVQAGAFVMREHAMELQGRLGAAGHATRLTEGPDGLHRVRVGPLSLHEEAARLADQWDGVLLTCSTAD
jgi:rare lipoprotein A